MKVQGKNYRTVWAKPAPAPSGGLAVQMIDQTLLPHRFEVVTLADHRQTARAIRDMIVRGAPAIGASGAYGLAQVAAEAPPGASGDRYIEEGYQTLRSTRPTAQDLFYALDQVRAAIEGAAPKDRARAALAEAERLADESVERCRKIGEIGAPLITPGMRTMTHCNAGWLACVDWGTALAPFYAAHREGRSPNVLVSETRPRLQGSSLTAWELSQEGIDYEIIADGASGLTISRGDVELIITGADRVAANGDVANKIGTYEKALLAREHGVPFYVAAPASTFDLDCPDGQAIPIEERGAEEVLYARGLADSGELTRVRLAPEGAKSRNPAFDVTPAALVTGLITERGIVEANAAAIARALGAE